jgi:hypothetical protein
MNSENEEKKNTINGVDFYEIGFASKSAHESLCLRWQRVKKSVKNFRRIIVCSVRNKIKNMKIPPFPLPAAQ